MIVSVIPVVDRVKRLGVADRLPYILSIGSIDTVQTMGCTSSSAIYVGLTGGLSRCG